MGTQGHLPAKVGGDSAHATVCRDPGWGRARDGQCWRRSVRTVLPPVKGARGSRVVVTEGDTPPSLRAEDATYRGALSTFWPRRTL